MYTLNGWWFLSSGGSYPPVFTVVYKRSRKKCIGQFSATRPLSATHWWDSTKVLHTNSTNDTNSTKVLHTNSTQVGHMNSTKVVHLLLFIVVVKNIGQQYCWCSLM